MMDVVDAITLARLVGSAAKVRALAQLSKAEGDLHSDAGDGPAADRAYRRALAVLREAHREEPEGDDDALLEALSDAVSRYG